MRATAPERPSLKQPDGPRALAFEERVTLFLTARHKGALDELLAGFAAAPASRARAFATLAAAWDSPRRQARLAHEFGGRADAQERLKALVTAAQPPLRGALVERLPERLRVSFPLESAPSSPAAKALAARLVREAAR